MAMRKFDTTSTPTAANTVAWNYKMFFPKDNYIIRCISEVVGVSSGGNPMVTLEWEIVNATPQQIGDNLVDFDGTKFKSYHVTSVKSAENATPEEIQVKSFKAAKGYQDRVLVPCGIDVSNGWDDENPPSILGKVVHALLGADENEQRATPTPEERAQGKKMGKVINDPLTGKPVIMYNIKLETIYGLFTGDVILK